MKSLETLSLGIGETKYLEDGTSVSVVEEEEGEEAEETAEHEAMHAVAAVENGTDVVSVSIAPGPGYLGITQLVKPDAVAALAPHSHGHRGTAFDVFVASQISQDVSSAEKTAKEIITRGAKKVRKVARLVQQKKIINGSEVVDAMKRAEQGVEVTVFIHNPSLGMKKLQLIQPEQTPISLSRETLLSR